MKGAPASRANRRAISVLPTPVGPIIRMFFGITSSRISGASCWRRQRLRSAIATARFASPWPTMNRSSSETISRGVRAPAVGSAGASSFFAGSAMVLQLFQNDVVIGVDADVGGNLHRLPGNGLGVEMFLVDQRPRRGQRI